METRGFSVTDLMTGLVTGLVFWGAPLFGGTADRPYTLLCALLCAACALLATRAEASRLRGSWFHLFFVVAIVATLLQAVPLPPALRAVLAPGSDGDLRQLSEQPHHFFALSVDVGATLHEAARLSGYLCLLVALTTLVTSERRHRRLMRQLVGGAALVAVLSLAAGLGLGKGLPSPIAVSGDGATRALFAASFHNSNHLAALMGLGALLLLESARAAQPFESDVAGRLRRVGLFALCALCNVVLVGTLSRAGIVVWLATQALWLLTQTRGRNRLRLLGGLFALGIVGPLLVMALWPTAFSSLRARFFASSLSEITAPGGKLYAWATAWPLLRGHLPLGVGRGAFESAFQHVQGLSGQLRFAYLENQWLQVVVDWGVPTACLLFALLFLGMFDALRGVAKREPGSPHAASRVALFALGGLAVHNLFDFNLEVGGVAVVAVGLLALCQRPHPRLTFPRVAATGLAISTVALVMFVAARFPSLDEDGARLRALCERRDISTGDVLARAQAAMLRHPLDAYLPALVAARLHADGQSQTTAMRWVNRALLADPREILARHTGAKILVENGHRDQGLLLLRGAIADADAEQRRGLLRTLRVLNAGADEILSTLALAPSRIDFLERLGTESPPPWPLVRELSERLLTEPVTGAERTAAATALGRSALVLRDPRAAELAALALLDDATYAPALLFADLTDLLGDSEKAAVATELLRKGLARGDRAELLLSLARLSERSGAVDEARKLLDRALAHAEDPALIARVHEVYGDLEAHAGNTFQATEHRREAARLRSRL